MRTAARPVVVHSHFHFHGALLVHRSHVIMGEWGPCTDTHSQSALRVRSREQPSLVVTVLGGGQLGGGLGTIGTKVSAGPPGLGGLKIAPCCSLSRLESNMLDLLFLVWTSMEGLWFLGPQAHPGPSFPHIDWGISGDEADVLRSTQPWESPDLWRLWGPLPLRWKTNSIIFQPAHSFWQKYFSVSLKMRKPLLLCLLPHPPTQPWQFDHKKPPGVRPEVF